MIDIYEIIDIVFGSGCENTSIKKKLMCSMFIEINSQKMVLFFKSCFLKKETFNSVYDYILYPENDVYLLFISDDPLKTAIQTLSPCFSFTNVILLQESHVLDPLSSQKLNDLYRSFTASEV